MAGSIHRGTITRTSPTGAWITIASQWPGVEFGPCDIVANAVRVGPLTAQAGGSPSHTHTIAKTEWAADYLQPGDAVLVVTTGPADFVIVGIIRTGISPTGGL